MTWTGTACAIGGVALLMVPGSAVHVDPAGIALSLLAGTCFGVYTVSAKALSGRDVGMAAAVSVTLLIGGSALLPWTLAGLPGLAAPRSAALVGWLGIATTAAAYMFFVTGLRRVTAAAAGTLSLAEPLVASALAIVVLGERLSVPVAAGSLLLLGGLFVVSVPVPGAERQRSGGSRSGRHLPGGVGGRPPQGTVPARSTRGRDAGRYDGAHATGAVKVEMTTGERK